MKHLYDFPEKGYKTLLQWAKIGMYPKNKDLDGISLWCNAYHQNYETYYAKEDVRTGTKDEIDTVLGPLRLKKKEANKRYRDKIRQHAIHEKRRLLAREKISQAMELPPLPVSILSKGIALDLETTGLDSQNDEILSISILDLDGNILLNSYVKPYWNDSWPSAYAVHGISCEMVNDAPFIHDLLPRIRGIFQTSELIVGYNIFFDLSFLSEYDIGIETKSVFDVMLEFAEIHGDWNEYYGSYTWQKLTTCAKFYGYEFKAHNSLEDTKATLYCYKKIKEGK